MADASLDIVSEVNFQELTNAIDQAKKEILNRFDFKKSISSFDLTKSDLTLLSDDEGKMNQLKDVLNSKLIKRGISLKSLKYGKLEQAAGQSVRHKAEFVQGLDQESCKIIHKLIKDSKLKLKSQTMDQKVRVIGKSRDDLQEIMALLKASDKITVPLQFTNFK